MIRDMLLSTLSTLLSSLMEIVVLHCWASGKLAFYTDFWKVRETKEKHLAMAAIEVPRVASSLVAPVAVRHALLVSQSLLHYTSINAPLENLLCASLPCRIDSTQSHTIACRAP